MTCVSPVDEALYGLATRLTHAPRTTIRFLGWRCDDHARVLKCVRKRRQRLVIGLYVEISLAAYHEYKDVSLRVIDGRGQIMERIAHEMIEGLAIDGRNNQFIFSCIDGYVSFSPFQFFGHSPEERMNVGHGAAPATLCDH